MSAGNNRRAEVERPFWLRAMLPAVLRRVKGNTQKDAEDARDSPRSGSPWAPESSLSVAGWDAAPTAAKRFALPVLAPFRTSQRPSSRRESGAARPGPAQREGEIMDSRPSNRPQHVHALERANQVRRAR